MQVVVNSLVASYQIAGNSGRTILLLHGWGDTQETFRQVIPQLAKKYKVVTLDLPGFGSSEQPAEAWGLAEYAQFVADFLRKLSIEPSAIVGHSNGGSIAIYGIAHAILRADKLVLVASAGVRNTKGQSLHRALWGTVAKVGKVATAALPKSARQRLRGKLYASAGSDMLVAEHMQETFKRVVHQDVQHDAATLKLPVLLIYGTDDDATPLVYGQTFNELITGSKLVTVTGASHFVHQEKPHDVAAAIEEFLG